MTTLPNLLSPIAPPPFSGATPAPHTPGAVAPSPSASARVYRVVPLRADSLAQGEILLPGMWKRLTDEKLLKEFFHDFGEITFGQFVSALSSPTDPAQLICEVSADGETILDTAGIGLLTNILVTPLVRRALGNFLFFRAYWGGEALHVGAALLDAWFTEFEVIAGTTPATNSRALAFVKRIGFSVVGSIPDYASYHGTTCPSIITQQTRRAWERNRAIILGAGDPDDDAGTGATD